MELTSITGRIPASPGNRILEYHGRTFTSADDIKEFIDTQPPSQRYAVQAEVLERMRGIHFKFSDAVEEVYNYVVQDGSYRTQLTDEDFQHAWAEVIEVIKVNTQRRDRAAEACKNISLHWAGTGDAWIKSRALEETSSLFSAVRKLAKRHVFPDAVACINQAMVTRLGTVGKGVRTSPKPLTGDIEKASAMNVIPARPTQDVLQKLGLCFDQFGLLKEGALMLDFPRPTREIEIWCPPVAGQGPSSMTPSQSDFNDQTVIANPTNRGEYSAAAVVLTGSPGAVNPDSSAIDTAASSVGWSEPSQERRGEDEGMKAPSNSESGSDPDPPVIRRRACGCSVDVSEAWRSLVSSKKSWIS